MFLGEYTVAEHYVPARLFAEVLYYHADKVLPDEWWHRHRLRLSVAVGFGLGIILSEIWEYYWFESENAAYTSALDRMFNSPDTQTDMFLGTINLGLFAFEKMFPPFEGVIIIETHSPIMAGRLNPFTSDGDREEVIFTSKFLAFSHFQFGIALGHGEEVTPDERLSGKYPSAFYRLFRPRTVGVEYSPGGPPTYGSYAGISIGYDRRLGAFSLILRSVLFTANQRKFGFRAGVAGALNY
ncbi:hypothetical protein IBX73_00905 [candidate division WOR-3 bacterium]|nr:hypothetical protein [candidate division WOR-3 bacterium]